jgi:hypothetical protein
MVKKRVRLNENLTYCGAAPETKGSVFLRHLTRKSPGADDPTYERRVSPDLILSQMSAIEVLVQEIEGRPFQAGMETVAGVPQS